MNKYTPTTPEIVELALRFFPDGIALPMEEPRWQESIEKALKFYQIADRIKGGGLSDRRGAGYVPIQTLVDDGKFGRSKEFDSVWEKRIVPRFPTEKEVARVRENLQLTESDSEVEILSKFKKAVSLADIAESRWAATVLCVLGWCPTREEVKASGTLHWNGDSGDFLIEKRITKPTEPPSLEDMSEDIDNAVSEYWNCAFMR